MLQLNTWLCQLLLYPSTQPGNATAIDCLAQHCYQRFTTAIQARALCFTAIQAWALFKPMHSRREILSLRSPKQEWEPGHQPPIYRLLGSPGLRVSGAPMTSWNDVREGLRVSEMATGIGAPRLKDRSVGRVSGSPRWRHEEGLRVSE